MKKRLYLSIITAALCINILGCGKIDSSSDSNTNSSSTVSSNNNNTSDTSSNINSNETVEPDNNVSDPTPEPTAVPKVTVGKLSAKQQYSDAYRVVKFLGLKEYKKIEGDTYTDKPKKGKKYLVLFLSIRNDNIEEDYINYNYISAKVDNKKIEHSFLVNEPKGYPTIFTHVAPGKSIGGFVVWEVPSDWKKLEFTYDGWKDINNVSVKAKFTPKDLSNPMIYNASDFN